MLSAFLLTGIFSMVSYETLPDCWRGIYLQFGCICWCWTKGIKALGEVQVILF